MPTALGPPGCPYDPGDAGISRAIKVQTVTLHRTIGTWPGDYSVGKHRTHDQGTFQHLIGQAPGQWVQFFPSNTFASHAYGANEAGPGIEISGQNGEPLTDWQIDALGQLLRWYRDEWGIRPTFTDGDPRVQYDTAGPGGFVTHRNVYSDIPQYTHHDYITADEFARALGGPTPALPKEPAVDYILARTDDGLRTLCTALGETEGIDVPYAEALIAGGMPQVKIDGVGYTNMLAIRRNQRAQFVASLPTGGGSSETPPVAFSGTFTATPAP